MMPFSAMFRRVVGRWKGTKKRRRAVLTFFEPVPKRDRPVRHPVDPEIVSPQNPGIPEDPTQRFMAELVHAANELQAGMLKRDRVEDHRELLRLMVEGGTDSIPHLPAAAQQALSLCNSPSTTTGEIVRLFERDPALAQALMRMANSTFYTTREPCGSITDAVVRVGVKGVRHVLMGFSVKGLLCRPGTPYAPMADQVWSHLSRVAPLARRMAASFGADPDHAFLLGLMHDVGKLIIFNRVAALRRKLRRDPEISSRFMQRLLQSFHEPLGGLAALRWGLGDEIATTIATHHRIRPPAWPQPLSEVVYVADRADLASVKADDLRLELVWSEGELVCAGHEGVAAMLFVVGQAEGQTDEWAVIS